MGSRLAAMSNLRILDPIGYLDFLKLIASARVVLTDSGGIQEETTILKVPCLTLRENTERPITLEVGSNRLVGSDPAKIIAAYRDIMTGRAADSEIPPLWDGHAAERIVEVLNRGLN
jgi:UDP-N-acetylglucosamine 2-epimerase (non-hydrolysing)